MRLTAVDDTDAPLWVDLREVFISPLSVFDHDELLLLKRAWLHPGVKLRSVALW